MVALDLLPSVLPCVVEIRVELRVPVLYLPALSVNRVSRSGVIPSPTHRSCLSPIRSFSGGVIPTAE